MVNSYDFITCGTVGTAIGTAGASMSVNEVQAIVSIVVTVAGFIISVVIPSAIAIYKKIKKAKEDGKVTIDEAKEIADTVKEETNKVIDGTKDVIDKIEKDKKK